MNLRSFLGLAFLLALPPASATAEDSSSLRLIPFPKKIAPLEGQFSLRQPLVFQSSSPEGDVAARIVLDELQRAGLPAPKLVRNQGSSTSFRISSASTSAGPSPAAPSTGSEEAYVLEVRPDAIIGSGPHASGVRYAAQTLAQLIRANRRGDAIPCLRVEDHPSLRWRCFQDDMTRGPSSKLETLQFEAGLGAFLKMNLLTYYMEYQFAFRKHPKIGPANGSLTPEDLKALVAFSRPLGVDVLGNQQSFGHFGNILNHPEYAPLRETPDVLSPVNDRTYQLLDDMYSEVCPLLPFPFFNVCCDETFGLGTGPSKDLAQKIGVGGVYVRHIRRIHDLLRQKYQKRMMMWGDIILMHPDKLSEIPKDTIMLTWGYDPRDNFENQILPFARSGYEFFVCPGVSDWSRILPDFNVAMTNISHFVRDGVKHGALGMINTDWEDDGEALKAVKWHADAWAAECAWNASKTTRADFQRRVGAVLFGEKGDHFGQAIELLAKTHSMVGMEGMMNRRFWQNDFLPNRDPKAIRASADRLLAVVKPAIEHLEACRREAIANRHVLDVYLCGTHRMELIAQRMIDGLEAARLYCQACDGPAEDAAAIVAKVEAIVRANRDAHQQIGRQFADLWLAESKPYALDWTNHRYAELVAWYDSLLAKLGTARKAAHERKPLPRPDELGLAFPEPFPRYLRPKQVVASPLAADTPWADPAASHRFGLVIRAGTVDRFELPVEVAVTLPSQLAARQVSAFCSISGSPVQEIPAQLDPAERPTKPRLVLLIPGPISKGQEASVHVYLRLTPRPQPVPQAASTRDASQGQKWMENDKVRLLLGPEGAHVYRWELKGSGNRDLTEPGESEWHGFADTGFEDRSARYQLKCLASGPALVRYQCTSPSGQVKTISLYANASWMDVVLSEPVGYYWDFDDPKNFAAEFSTPGQYLFSTGAHGRVGKHADAVAAQVKASKAHWAIKFASDRLALGMTTPESAVCYTIGPGSGAGGVGVESPVPAAHFVSFAGQLPADPAVVMTRLQQTLDLNNPPELVLFALQNAPK